MLPGSEKESIYEITGKKFKKPLPTLKDVDFRLILFGSGVYYQTVNFSRSFALVR